MSVRMSLLAILGEGPDYGYQLRAQFERRTGATWPLNVGQVYTTLDRLERDGMVQRQDEEDDGKHRRYAITAEGRAEVERWLQEPVQRIEGSRDELPIKLALAATLPGVDVEGIVHAQRRASLARLQRFTVQKREAPDAASHEDFAWLLVLDGLIFQIEAELRWLDHVEARVRAAAGQRRRWTDAVAAPVEETAR